MVLERHVRSQHNKEVQISFSNCIFSSFFKQSIKVHVKSHPKNDNAKVLIIGCIQCKENNDHKIWKTETDPPQKFECANVIKLSMFLKYCEIKEMINI